MVMMYLHYHTHHAKADPGTTTKALLMHNDMVVRAKYDNFGYVMEQEGDSFSIMFYDPEDAVKFCLQMQQLLAEAQWPDALLPLTNMLGRRLGIFRFAWMGRFLSVCMRDTMAGAHCLQNDTPAKCLVVCSWIWMHGTGHLCGDAAL